MTKLNSCHPDMQGQSAALNHKQTYAFIKVIVIKRSTCSRSLFLH